MTRMQELRESFRVLGTVALPTRWEHPDRPSRHPSETRPRR